MSGTSLCVWVTRGWVGVTDMTVTDYNQHVCRWQLYSPVRASDISWNFAKFLVGKDGKPVKRYSPDTVPSAIAADIEALLG